MRTNALPHFEAPGADVEVLIHRLALAFAAAFLLVAPVDFRCEVEGTHPLLGCDAILIAGLTAYTLKETTGCSLDDDEKIEEKEKLIENGQDNAETATIDSNASF